VACSRANFTFTFTIVLVFRHWREGLLTIAQSIRVCAAFPVFWRAWTMAGKSGMCCDDPDFQELVVNIFEETSNSEGTEDDFQENFQNTESEEGASDEEHDDYSNNNIGNNGDDGYFRAKNFVWLKKLPPQNVLTRIHNIISRIRRTTAQGKLEQDDCTQKSWTCYLPNPCYKK
jgi:hypothetical protein